MATGRPKAWPTICDVLISGVAGEVGDVERERGPVADHRGERGKEEVPESCACRVEVAGRGEHGAEAAGFVQHEAEQQAGHEEHEGRGEALQEADGLDAAPDDEHVEQPEAEEAGPARPRHGAVEGAMTLTICAMAWPPIQDWMPNQPQATMARSIAGMLAPRGPKEARTKTGKRDAVLRAGVRVQQHGDQHDEVAEQDREDGLLPVHAAGDQRGGEHVGGDLHRHGEPQRDVVVGAPGALRGEGRGEVGVVEAWVVAGFCVEFRAGVSSCDGEHQAGLRRWLRA